MALYRVQVILPATSGNPDDVSTNTLHFDINDESFIGEVWVALNDFYTFIAPLYSSLVDTDESFSNWYRLSDPEPRAPIAVRTMNLGNSGADTLPTECAMVLSYQADKISGLPQARRRNRIYIGPLAKAAVEDDGYISATWYDGLRGAAKQLLDASEASPNWTWAVYSKTDNLGHPVTNGWVDDAFDTQRRRGREARSRRIFRPNP